MNEWIKELFSTIFGGNVILATIFIAMLPVIELRGAIPFAMAAEFWGSRALSSFSAFGWAFLGSSLVVPILALMFFPFLNWLKQMKWFKKLAEKIESTVKHKSQKIAKAQQDSEQKQIKEKFYDKKGNLISKEEHERILSRRKFLMKFWGILVFVAVPIPFTGVWMGTCVSLILGMGFWWTCLTVISGNLCAGLIMTLISSFFPNATDIVLYVFLALVFIIAVYGIIKAVSENYKNKKAGASFR